MPPMSAAHGWGRETFSLALAVQNLTWGLVQPFFGMVADRFGAGRAVAAGVAFYVTGLALMPFAETGLTLVLSAGLLIGTGLGGTGFAQQSSALGVAGALGSLGQFLMVPVTHHLIGHLGWAATLTVLAGTSGLMAPLAFLLVKQRRAADRSPASAAPMPLGAVLREAMRHRGFWLLNLGFVVCGFQLAFITNHLPAFLADHGLPPATAMTALAVIGAANILGTWLCGVLGGRLRGKHVLAAVYLLRTVATVAYVSVPVTAASTIAYAAAMGLTWLGTVPLTTGVVARIFGVQYLATLFGFVFLGHQIGVHMPIDDRTLALPRAAPLPARP